MTRSRGRSATYVIMEGYLTIPPDRGTILGRAIWKTRYVVIGSAQGEVDDGKSRSSLSNDGITYLSIYKNPDDWEPSQQYAVSNVTSCEVQMVAHRKQGPVLPTLIVTITPDPATEKLRKRRSSRAATLVSTNNKDSGPTTLWFRTEGDVAKLHEWARSLSVASQPNYPDSALMSPLSPLSPSGPATPCSPSFQNPFVPYAPSREGADFFSPSSVSAASRPPSAPSAPRVSLHHKASSSLHTHPERPLTISDDAPSLRSKRSDLSSLPGSVANFPSAAQQQGYTSILPSDLPTPSEGGSIDGELFGWTSAQGRVVANKNAAHSPARTVRDSLGSNPAPPAPPPLSPPTTAAAILDITGSTGVSLSPPGPRETILDRAFQLKYIPGCADQPVLPGAEKLSSLARFEALMQQVEQDSSRRRNGGVPGGSTNGETETSSSSSSAARHNNNSSSNKRSSSATTTMMMWNRPPSVREQLELKSAWELDESDEDSDADSDDTEGELGMSAALDRDTEADNSSIRPESRRTATFPSSTDFHLQRQQQQQQQQYGQKHKQLPTPQTPIQSPRGTAGIRSPLTLNPDALAALVSGGSTSEASPERPRLAHRMHSAMGSLSLGIATTNNNNHHNQNTHPHHLNTPTTGNIEASSAAAASPGGKTTSSSDTASTYDGALNPAAAYRTSTILEGQQLHRLSTASNSTTNNGGGGHNKRLSFTEFTRRLSSTGTAMLLTSSSQSQAGTPTGEAAADNNNNNNGQQLGHGHTSSSQSRRGSSVVFQPRAPPAAMSGQGGGAAAAVERNEKCKSWRNSVGMFSGNDGGFL